MTGIANYCFEMVRAQQQLDAAIDYLGFTGVGWRAVDTAYLEQVARDHQKTSTQTRATSNLLRATAGSGLERLARTAARFGPARKLYRSLRRSSFSRSMAQAGEHLDLFHAFNFQPHAAVTVPTLPVIYDLSFVRFPEAHPRERLQSLENLPETIARAPFVQTISEFSKREIIDVYGYAAEQIIVAPPAASAVFRPLGPAATSVDLQALGLSVDGYFLAVGTLEPRKNIKTLIAAFTRLSPDLQSRCPLVIVGAKGWGQLDLPTQTDRLAQSGALRFFGSVSDAELRSLYEGARLLLFPSIYEGFGMPVVEAMACGSAVAHSAETSMDEISGGLAARVAATDVDAWTDVMMRAAPRNAAPHDMERRRRMTQAATFSWRHSAAAVIDIYRKMENRPA